MSKNVDLELSVVDETGSTFRFSRSFDEVAVSLSQLEMVFQEARDLVREALLSTEAELQGRIDSRHSFIRTTDSEIEKQKIQEQIAEIRSNPGDAALQINRLSRDRIHLQSKLGKANEQLQSAMVIRQKREDLYARAKARGLAPFELNLSVQEADREIEKLSSMLIEYIEREDAFRRERAELRARLMAGNLASATEILEWKTQS